MDPTIIAAIPGAIVAIAALAVFFVRSTAEKSVVEGVRLTNGKLDTLNAEIAGLRGDMGVARERLAGEVGKLDIRLTHLERVSGRQTFPFRDTAESS